MNDDPAAPPTGLSGPALMQPGRASGGRKSQRQARSTWPVLVPLLGIPAFIIAAFVTSSIQSPPDFCGLPHGPTCQHVDAQISAIRLTAWCSLALALVLWLAAFALSGRRVRHGGQALLVLAGNAALLCAFLLWLRVGLCSSGAIQSIG